MIRILQPCHRIGLDVNFELAHMFLPLLNFLFIRKDRASTDVVIEEKIRLLLHGLLSADLIWKRNPSFMDGCCAGFFDQHKSVFILAVEKEGIRTG